MTLTAAAAWLLVLAIAYDLIGHIGDLVMGREWWMQPGRNQLLAWIAGAPQFKTWGHYQAFWCTYWSVALALALFVAMQAI